MAKEKPAKKAEKAPKAAAKATPAEKPAEAAPVAAKAPKEKKVVKSMTKSVFYTEIGAAVDLPKTKIGDIFKAMESIVVKQLGSKGPRVVTIPGLLKLKSKPTKAVKGGEKKINPLTKLEYITKPKPASVKITARPLKGLKEALGK